MYVIASIIGNESTTTLGNCYHAVTFEEAKKFAIKLAKYYCEAATEEEILFQIQNCGYFLEEEFDPYKSIEICIQSTLNLEVGNKVKYTVEPGLTSIGEITKIDGENINIKDTITGVHCWRNQYEVEYWDKTMAR